MEKPNEKPIGKQIVQGLHVHKVFLGVPDWCTHFKTCSADIFVIII